MRPECRDHAPGLGERRLAVAARAFERRRNAATASPFASRSFCLQRRRIRRAAARNRPAAPAPSSARAFAGCRPAGTSDQAVLNARQVEVVDLAKPARQFPVAETRAFDRRNRLALLARKTDFARTTGLASAAGVTTRTKCCSAFDRIASSIWLHQSRPPSSATMSCQTERLFSASQSAGCRAGRAVLARIGNECSALDSHDNGPGLLGQSTRVLNACNAEAA